MKLNLNPEKLTKIISGKLIICKENSKIDEFSTDTRRLKKGDIFWALKGKNYDANLFIYDAIKNGARGIISSKKPDLEKIKNLEFYIYVKDTLKALHRLAEYHISKFNIKTVSVTGSNGKTTTKELIRIVLESKANVIYNPGNFNNEYGLPLSVLNTEKKHKYGVFEIGSSRKGEVKKLARIIKPDISVITTIAPEHLEFFKTMENIFKTETEVITEMKKYGVIIINGDNEYLKRLKKMKNVISFGYERNNDLIIKIFKDYAIFNYEGKEIKIEMKNHIEHNYLNAAAAFIVGKLLKIPEEKIKTSLKNFEGVRLRMEIIKRKNSIIILDAYNANPQSMELALKEISKTKKFSLVVGDMKELGKYSEKYHKELGEKIINLSPQPESIFLVGEEIYPAYKIIKERIKNVKYYKDTNSALSNIKDYIKKNKDINILIKASRSMKFEKFLE